MVGAIGSWGLIGLVPLARAFVNDAASIPLWGSLPVNFRLSA